MKVAITVAPLAQTYYDDVDSFPTPERLAQEIVECCQAGASVVHLHVIDEKGNATVDTSNNVELVAKAREIIEHLGRQVASPAETREMFGIAPDGRKG